MELSQVVVIDESQLPFLDIESDAYAADPIGETRAAHLRGPLARSKRGIEILSYPLANSVLADPRFVPLDVKHFARMGAPQSMVEFAANGFLPGLGRERHERIRKVLLRAFSMRRVDAERELMRRCVDELLTEFEGSGHCDVVKDMSEQLPVRVLCALLGIPVEDIELFHRSAIDLHLMGAVPLAPGFSRIDDALSSIHDYVVDLFELRRREPRDDFMTTLIQAQDADAQLSEAELTWNVVNLIFAGQDTTRYQLASAVRAFVEDGRAWDRLANDPSLVPNALEEALRFYPVSQFLVRLTDEDAELDGYVFPAGRRVIINSLGTSRDPSYFERPDVFDIDREPSYKLPFGRGIHYCLGHALARAEMTEALIMMTSRLKDLKIVEPIELGPATAMISGPESLKLEFARR